MAHGVTPEALAEALRATPGARAALIVSPTYYGMAADVAGLRRGRATPRACRSSSTRRGARTSASTPTCRRPRCSRAPTRCSPRTHKIVGSLTQSAMLHVAATGRIDPDAVARAVRLVRSTSPVVAADGLARRRAAPAGHPRPGAARRARSRPPTARARSSTARRRAAWSGASWSGSRASPAGIRCGSSSTCAPPAAAATRSPPRCAPPTTCTSSSPRTPRSCSCSGSASPPTRSSASPTTSPPPCGGSSGRATPRRSCGPRPRWSTRSWSRRARRSSARRRRCAVDDAVGRVSAESIAGYPPGIPALLPGERITAEVVAYLRELRESGARLHGASDPDFRTIVVLCELTDDELIEAGARRGRRRRRRDDRGDGRRGRARRGRRSRRRRPA